MKEYVLDANAILGYLRKQNIEVMNKIENLLDLAETGQARLFMSVINMGEVLYVLMKTEGEQVALEAIRTLRQSVTMIGADSEQTIHAATIKHRYKLGYADSYAAALALQRKATLVSADPDFGKMGRAMKWLKIPSFV